MHQQLHSPGYSTHLGQPEHLVPARRHRLLAQATDVPHAHSLVQGGRHHQVILHVEAGAHHIVVVACRVEVPKCKLKYERLLAALHSNVAPATHHEAFLAGDVEV